MPCSMGVGCDESGVCYAAAHGQPDRCPRAPQLNDIGKKPCPVSTYKLHVGSYDDPMTCYYCRQTIYTQDKSTLAPGSGPPHSGA